MVPGPSNALSSIICSAARAESAVSERPGAAARQAPSISTAEPQLSVRLRRFVPSVGLASRTSKWTAAKLWNPGIFASETAEQTRLLHRSLDGRAPPTLGVKTAVFHSLQEVRVTLHTRFRRVETVRWESARGRSVEVHPAHARVAALPAGAGGHFLGFRAAVASVGGKSG